MGKTHSVSKRPAFSGLMALPGPETVGPQIPEASRPLVHSSCFYQLSLSLLSVIHRLPRSSPEARAVTSVLNEPKSGSDRAAGCSRRTFRQLVKLEVLKTGGVSRERMKHPQYREGRCGQGRFGDGAGSAGGKSVSVCAQTCITADPHS